MADQRGHVPEDRDRPAHDDLRRALGVERRREGDRGLGQEGGLPLAPLRVVAGAGGEQRRQRVAQRQRELRVVAQEVAQLVLQP